MRSDCSELPNYNRRQISESLASSKNYYTESLPTHGLTAKDVGWEDERSRLLRFKKLAQVIDWSISEAGITIDDWGCGYGAMVRYFDALPSARICRYYGYNHSEERQLRVQPKSTEVCEYDPLA